MLMSLPEIWRVGTWSLRGLGFSYGTAERAVRLLLWTEAAQGQAVRMLRRGEAQITTATKADKGNRTRDGQQAWTLASGGRHLLEIGAPAIDLATADARIAGAGHIALSGAPGAWLTASLCDLALHRKLGAVAVYAAPADEILPDGFARTGWIAGFRAAGASHYFAGTLAADAAAFLATTPLRAASDMVTRDIAAAGQSTEDRPAAGYLGLSVLAADGAAAWTGAALPSGIETRNYHERVAHAYRHGVEVEKIDCDHLYEIERRTWAPTSERSRAQAGYGKFGDGTQTSSAPTGG